MLSIASLVICSALAAPSASRPAGGTPVVDWTQAGKSGAVAIERGEIRLDVNDPVTAGAVSSTLPVPPGCEAVLFEARVTRAAAARAITLTVHDAATGEAVGYWQNPLPIAASFPLAVAVPITSFGGKAVRLFAGTHDHASRAHLADVRWTPLKRNMNYRSVVWGALVDDAHRAGQTFVARSRELAAVVVRVRDLNVDVRPAARAGLRARLFEWHENAPTTRERPCLAETIIARDQIPLADGSSERELTISLRALTRPGATYYVEFTADGPCTPREGLLLFSGEEGYAGGTRYENENALPHSDLYLQTFDALELPRAAESKDPAPTSVIDAEPKASPVPAPKHDCLPEPPVPTLASRSNCYSMVYYYLVDDEAQTRRQLETLRDLGATRVLTLVYWWQAETLGGDYWKKDYPPSQIGEPFMRSLDYFVRISHELGLRPALRLGSFREWNGLWHPAEPSGSVERYAEWVGRIARRYAGKIDHYVIGDEENKPHAATGFDGSARAYLEKMLIPLAKAVREGDPAAKISACGSSSSPATTWTFELIKLGLPQYADGLACNLWYVLIEDRWEIEQFLRQVREVWPQVRFYANGVVYANHRGLNDAQQAGIVAHAMFTLWDLGWESAPYYLYTFSRTADTNEDFGLLRLPTATQPAEVSDAWHAYQTIAQTFRDRRELSPVPFRIRLRQADQFRAADGSTLRIAPPEPLIKAWIRGDRQLLMYLVYPDSREPRSGRWDVVLETKDWACPQEIPLFDYRKRVDQGYDVEGDSWVVPAVPVSAMPKIITLRRVRAD